MKGTHISKKTQRRLLNNREYENMSIKLLMNVIDAFDMKILRIGFNESFKTHRYLHIQTNRAKAVLRGKLGIY